MAEIKIYGKLKAYTEEGKVADASDIAGLSDAIASSLTQAAIIQALGYTPGTSNFSGAYADLIGKPSLATVATSGSYNDLSDKPTSLPASDVYSWAKASVKPSYDFSEIRPGNIILNGNQNYINTRSGHDQYDGGMYYSTPGNEALVFANKNSVTSFIFKTGLSCKSIADWTTITPDLQIKNGRVTIGKLIPNEQNGSYNLDVNGTANATTIYENGVRVVNTNDSRLSDARPANGGVSGTVVGTYSGNGGQQGPDYYGRNRVGFLMSNQPVNGYTNYTNWIYMDNYNGNDVGGATAIGVARTQPRAFIMQSDANRSSWNNITELISVYNISSYAITSHQDIGQATLTSNLGMGSLNNNTTWGTTTAANGYTVRWGSDQPAGGGFVISEKDGQTHIQIDGEVWVAEGQKRLAHADEIIANAGSSPNLNDGTTVTQPGGNNAISIKTPGSAHDTGIFYMSQDNAYICNSSDNAYSFAVFDTDLTTNFSSVNDASFVVLSSGTGAKIRGNRVLHSGNTFWPLDNSTLYVNATSGSKYMLLNFTSAQLQIRFYSSSGTLMKTKTLLAGSYIVRFLPWELTIKNITTDVAYNEGVTLSNYYRIGFYCPDYNHASVVNITDQDIDPNPSYDR